MYEAVTNEFEWKRIVAENYKIQEPRNYYQNRDKKAKTTVADTSDPDETPEMRELAEQRNYILPLNMANNFNENYWTTTFGEMKTKKI